MKVQCNCKLIEFPCRSFWKKDTETKLRDLRHTIVLDKINLAIDDLRRRASEC